MTQKGRQFNKLEFDEEVLYMKCKSLAGALIIWASIILLSTLQICAALYPIATATVGFVGTYEPEAGTVLLYVLSCVLLIGGTALIILDVFSKEQPAK